MERPAGAVVRTQTWDPTAWVCLSAPLLTDVVTLRELMLCASVSSGCLRIK